MDGAELAIGLAGAVLKLILLSIDFVGDAKQVYKQGATDRSIDLSMITKSIAITTESLETQLRVTEENELGEEQSLDPERERLKELSQRAAKIGRELEQKLTHVTTDKGSKWRSFKATVLGTWNSDEIKATEQRLVSIKDEMQLSVLVNIRNKVDRSHDSNESRLLTKIEDVANQQALSREDRQYMIGMLNSADGVNQVRHDELVQIGSQLLKGISAPPATFTPNFPSLITLHEDVRKRAENIILTTLWYSGIWDREETISEAHATTAQWIFEDPKTTGQIWDSFVDFLQGDLSMFWVTGKPGCGKSTLMKFINQNPKTRVLLRDWAGQRELLLIPYYFYYNGGEYQKSEVGLIRSLLYSILNRRRELIPIAFGDRFQAAAEGKKLDEPSLPEARKALKNLILQHSDLCFFLSIDGLHEFDPAVSTSRVQSLIDFTHSFEKNRNVKVLVSSRPLPEFERGYDGYASLRVHDLTQRDIRQYAHERLMNHPRMRNLSQNDSRNTSDLLQSLVESSLGVFLWVRLVTESLLEGLTNYDTISDLKKRLNELPSDLEDLYRTILSRIDSIYKSQSARLISFVYYIHGRPCMEKLTLLDLWFAANADDEMVYKTEVKALEDEDVQERIREIEMQLKSRCRGLIETVPTNIYSYSNGPPVSVAYDLSTREHRTTARFIHRSVYEFLSRPTVWDNVIGKFLGRTFSVTLALFRSAILILKTCRLSSYESGERTILITNYTGVRAQLAEQETKQSHTDLVQELDRTMQIIMPTIERVILLKMHNTVDQTDHWSVRCRQLAAFEPLDAELNRRKYIRWPLDSDSHSSLMAFAAEFGLQHYIRSQLHEKGRKVLQKSGLPLLGHALIPFTCGYENRSLSSETVKLLLEEGARPNEVYKGLTLWQWFLWSLPLARSDLGTCSFIPSLFLSRLELMEILLDAGADPNGRVLCDEKSDSDRFRTPNLNVCTILFALKRLRQESVDRRNSLHSMYVPTPAWDCQCDEVIQRMIQFLEGGGGGGGGIFNAGGGLKALMPP
ncbi:hypothetical protein O1611_g9046 [Lasiodiplodia mahajangana]|uniref:Uncharacterized protein n=1 Tax=Lasiodiplodia mahajangana TaxID=1108764 RepID=A0ACC2JAU6_9PEZI|nr:hypothetical protein O1611_g9046 [Lasiodiplodia mahajangana]